jgi:hypothetical protein
MTKKNVVDDYQCIAVMSCMIIKKNYKAANNKNLSHFILLF